MSKAPLKSISELTDADLRGLIEEVQLEVQYRATNTTSMYRQDQLGRAHGYLYSAFLCLEALVRKPKELPKDG